MSSLLVLFLAVALAGPLGWAQQAGKTGAKKDEKKEEKKGLPLKPDRKVEFTTDEATWLSLDVSPNGKTIVFELLGDLYTLPVEGGEAKPLTTGLPFDSQPKFSPDGEWIAFLSDRDGAENLWVMKADGSEPRKLSKDEMADFASPVWTPDGQYVVVSRSTWGLRTYELWMYHIHGGGGVQMTKAKPTPTTPNDRRLNALGASFSPDGRYIYYARRHGGFQYNAMFPLWQIARHDRVTGDDDVLTEELRSAMRPVVSPDGSQLVYATRFETQTGLKVLDLKTGDSRWLKYPVQRDDQESRFTRDLMPGYAFLPGGKELVVSYGGKIHRVGLAGGKDELIPFTAKVSEDIGPNLYFDHRVEEGPVHARIIQNPMQSPDGKRLVFSALTHLYVMDLPAASCAKPCRGTPRRLLPRSETREFQPVWSPDGQWIAYVTWSEGGGQIWKVQADGQDQPQQLTQAPAFYSEVAWAPDGTRLVALRSSAQEHLMRPVDFGNEPGMDLVWIPAEGGEAHLVIPSRGVGRPHFTHDASRIYLYSNQGLISLRFDGTDRREHLKVEGAGLYFAEKPVPADDVMASPDGKWALAHVMNQLYLVAMPEVGGETPTVNVNKPSVPVKKLTDIGADYFAWADDGKTIIWAIGPSFFREPVSTIQFEPPKKDESAASNGEKKQAAEAEKEKEEAASVEEVEAPVEVPRAVPKGTVVLRGATVITMKGDEVLKDADIVVTDNKIVSVGRRERAPAGAQVFDVRGMTIVPGFVDTHPHWTEIRRGILDIENWSFLANLAYGVTAGRDPQTGTNDMFAYQDLADAGVILGPRAYSTGPGIFSNNSFKSETEVKDVLERYKKYYRTPYIKSYLVGNRKQREWMVEACKEVGIMPTTEGGLDLKMDLTHALDGFAGNEHALPIIPLYKDVVELFAKTHIGYTPTLIVAYGGPFAENYFYESTEVHDNAKLNRFTPHNIIDAKTKRRPFWFRKDEYSFSGLAEGAGKVLRAGGHIGIGSHGQLQGLGYHWEMWALASGGLKPMEVLRAATIEGATILGLEKDLGSIEPGKMADLVILAKNPLDDIHNTNTIRYVMKNGELFEGDTLNEVWPQKKPLAPLWWWNEKPPEQAQAARP